MELLENKVAQRELQLKKVVENTTYKVTAAIDENSTMYYCYIQREDSASVVGTITKIGEEYQLEKVKELELIPSLISMMNEVITYVNSMEG